MNIYLIILAVIIAIRIIFIRPQQKTKQVPKQKEYGRISRTRAGQLVRSGGEKLIADFLATSGIVYIYEPKLGPYRPDFYLPDYKLVIEYYGMAHVNGRDGEIYREKMKEKTKYYINNNIKVLSLLPAHLGNGQYKRLIRQFVK